MNYFIRRASVIDDEVKVDASSAEWSVESVGILWKRAQAYWSSNAAVLHYRHLGCDFTLRL